jgi:hypothetical protein
MDLDRFRSKALKFFFLEAFFEVFLKKLVSSIILGIGHFSG